VPFIFANFTVEDEIAKLKGTQKLIALMKSYIFFLKGSKTISHYNANIKGSKIKWFYRQSNLTFQSTKVV
jgi:hypothetical protein